MNECNSEKKIDKNQSIEFQDLLFGECNNIVKTELYNTISFELNGFHFYVENKKTYYKFQ